MKFDEKKWRTLAANKPDELHSYIPQSSICELFDEIERLEHEIAKCKEANKDVQSRLDDYRQDYEKVVNDLCPTDERHCGCVPILRRENRLISEELADAKDELKHRRDAFIPYADEGVGGEMSEQYRCKSCGYVFDMKDMMCSECGVGYLERLRWTKGGDGSHFEGCEDVHLDCRIAQLEKENARLTAENERLSQLLHDEISQLEIATDLGNKRWIALNQIYEDGEKHNANWCKRKAQEGLGIKNA